MLNSIERDFYIEWIVLIENYSEQKKESLKRESEEILIKKFKLALLKSEDEMFV